MVGPKYEGTINGAGQVNLGCAAGSRVSSWVVQFESSSFSGSLTIKSAVQDSDYTRLAVGYKDFVTGTASTAAITGNALVLVDSSGVDVQLDCTAYTSGSLTYKAVPLVG